jgi:hypothetical protein
LHAISQKELILKSYEGLKEKDWTITKIIQPTLNKYSFSFPNCIQMTQILKIKLHNEWPKIMPLCGTTHGSF